MVINAVGRELYELFFRGYTRKQWGLDPSELDKSVTARIPTRTNTDDRYFTDTFQAMPLHGYTRMFETDARPSADRGPHRRRLSATFATRSIPTTSSTPGRSTNISTIRFGKLPYRSLKFDHQTLEQEQFQAVGTVNYPVRGNARSRGSANTSI